MKEKTILEQMQEFLREYKDDKDLVISMETELAELELDSLDTIDMVMELEDKMGVSIELSKELNTIGKVVNIIESQKNKKA